MLDIIGKRFLGYITTLVLGLVGAHLMEDGVKLSHFYNFSQVIFGVYVAGQSATDGVAFLKGLKSLTRG
jgi:hypothetical protein